MADQRGAVALETLIVFVFLIGALLAPLADVAAAGFQFISAWEALRGFGQYVQYLKAGFDATNSSTWPSGKTIGSYTIANPQVLCGDVGAGVACTSSNLGSSPVKYFTYSTTVTLSPLVLRSMLCTSGNANPCRFTLTYSERFL